MVTALPLTIGLHFLRIGVVCQHVHNVIVKSMMVILTRVHEGCEVMSHKSQRDSDKSLYYCDGCDRFIGECDWDTSSMKDYHVVDQHNTEFIKFIDNVIKDKNRHYGTAYYHDYHLCDRCYQKLSDLQNEKKKKENICPKCGTENCWVSPPYSWRAGQNALSIDPDSVCKNCGEKNSAAEMNFIKGLTLIKRMKDRGEWFH